MEDLLNLVYVVMIMVWQLHLNMSFVTQETLLVLFPDLNIYLFSMISISFDKIIFTIDWKQCVFNIITFEQPLDKINMEEIVSIDYQWCPHDTKVTHIEESYFTLSVSKGGHLYNLREMLGEVDCI